MSFYTTILITLSLKSLKIKVHFLLANYITFYNILTISNLNNLTDRQNSYYYSLGSI